MRKRLSCEIPTDLHVKIKKIAKRRNITITRYITRALYRYLLQENKYEDKERKPYDTEQINVTKKN